MAYQHAAGVPHLIRRRLIDIDPVTTADEAAHYDDSLVWLAGLVGIVALLVCLCALVGRAVYKCCCCCCHDKPVVTQHRLLQHQPPPSTRVVPVGHFATPELAAQQGVGLHHGQGSFAQHHPQMLPAYASRHIETLTRGDAWAQQSQRVRAPEHTRAW